MRIADSPVGLAGWMLDHDARSQELIARVFDGQTEGLTRDDILDNITLYWLTNTAVSSARLYWESKLAFFAPKNVTIPTAVSVFPDEIYAAPRSWAERAYPKLIHFNTLPKGGHFAAWEQPELFTAELRAPSIAPLDRQLTARLQSQSGHGWPKRHTWWRLTHGFNVHYGDSYRRRWCSRGRRPRERRCFSRRGSRRRRSRDLPAPRARRNAHVALSHDVRDQCRSRCCVRHAVGRAVVSMPGVIIPVLIHDIRSSIGRHRPHGCRN